MAIYTPGKRARRGGQALTARRNVVAVLQLTAMVDMFTVLVVFLLQNYASTNQILPMADQISLPEATAVKELMPSLVVELSKERLSFNELPVARFGDLARYSAVIPALLDPVQRRIEELDEKHQKDSKKRKLIEGGEEILQHFKMTLQVDKDIDFLTVKKVLYTLYEAGAQEINFAVIRVEPGTRYENVL